MFHNREHSKYRVEFWSTLETVGAQGLREPMTNRIYDREMVCIFRHPLQTQ